MSHSRDYFYQQEPPDSRPKEGFAMPDNIDFRRAWPGAAAAYQHARRCQYPAEAQARIIACHICGELMPQDWCLMCERKKTPFSAKYPHLRAPYCEPCKKADVPCRVCGTVPSAGPNDMDFAPEGWREGMEGAVGQAAGHA